MRKIRKFTIVFAILSLVLFMQLSFAMSHSCPKPALQAAFAATGAKLSGVEINAWSNISQEFLTLERLEAMASTAMASFQVEAGKTSRQSTAREKFRQIEFSGVTKDGEFVAILAQSFLTTGSQPGGAETYLVVNCRVPGDQFNWRDLEKKVRESIEKNHGIPGISTCLIGVFNGKLNNEGMQSLAEKAFAAAGATVKETVSDGLMMSMAGYTSQVEDCVTVGGQKLNLHFVLRYNPAENLTHLLIGTPVITLEY